MTQFEKRRSYLGLSLSVGIALLLFCWGSYQLVASQTYYHVTVEQYAHNNETVTEAFKKESALRRHLERSLAAERIASEQKDESLLVQNRELKTKEKTLEEMELQFKTLQYQFKKTKYEKDSLSTVIASLRRVH